MTSASTSEANRRGESLQQAAHHGTDGGRRQRARSRGFPIEQVRWHRAGMRSASACVICAALLMAPAAPAAITPSASSISARSVADIDPDDVNSPDLQSDSTTGVLRNLNVSTAASDALAPDLFESVATSASVTYAGATSATVHLFGARLGTDSAPGSPGGEYDSRASYRLSFQNLALDTLTVDWTVVFERPNTGTFTPLGIGLSNGANFESIGPSVPFDSGGGSVTGSKKFTLDGTGFAGLYTLELDLAMAGVTTDLAAPERWDATFVLTTPEMTITPVPEPALPLLFLSGLGVLAGKRMRDTRGARIERNSVHSNCPQSSCVAVSVETA
jgi:hypothetical protein